MKRFAALVLIISAIVVVGPAGEAEACSCALLDPAQMLEDSEAAFVGTLVEAPAEPIAAGGFEGVWVFAVEEWVKGDLGPQIGVHSPLDGAACGLEMVEGQRAGVFLHNESGHPASNLCSVTTPDALLSADRPLVVDGSGPPVFLLAAETGRARLATLDPAGRLLAVAAGEEPIWSVSVCPGSRRLVEATANGITVREVATLEAVDESTADPPPEQVWCVQEEAREILALFPIEDGRRMRLQRLGDSEPLYVGEYHSVVTGPDAVALPHPEGNVELIRFADGQTQTVPTGAEPGAVDFSPDGDRLLVTETHHDSTGHYTTIARIHDVDSGEQLWQSDPLADTEVTGWLDDRTLAAAHYPVEADRPREFIIDIETGETTETDLAGWEFFTTAGGVASTENGHLYVKVEGEPATRLASLPSPNHRLVAVLDRAAAIEIPATTRPAPSSTPQAAPGAGTAAIPSVVAVGLAAAVVAVGTAVVFRRRRTH